MRGVIGEGVACEWRKRRRERLGSGWRLGLFGKRRRRRRRIFPQLVEGGANHGTAVGVPKVGGATKSTHLESVAVVQQPRVLFACCLAVSHGGVGVSRYAGGLYCWDEASRSSLVRVRDRTDPGLVGHPSSALDQVTVRFCTPTVAALSEDSEMSTPCNVPGRVATTPACQRTSSRTKVPLCLSFCV